MKRKIGIIGGAFNPPHNAHIMLGKYAHSYFNLEKVVYIPTNIPSHKPAESLWKGTVRSLMIKTALYCQTPQMVREELIKLIPGNEGIEHFIEKYHKGYKKFNNEAFSVSDIEIQSERISFTIDTVKKLLSQDRDIDIHIIIGMDQAAVLDTWKDYIELSRIAVFCAAGRPGINSENVKKRFPFIRIFPFPESRISSSMIRQRMDAGQSIGRLVPPALRDLLILLRSMRA